MSATPDLTGRIALVTGATSGIGEETAIGLAALGARVLLVGRSAAKAEATREALLARVPGADVEVLLADFVSLAEVRDLAERVDRDQPALHLLVNNAGVVNLDRELTADGHEGMLGVNHLAPFLLTSLLRGKLLASAPARIVNVSSDAHRFGAFDFDDPMSERKFGFPRIVTSMRVYGMSKLANVLFTAELARRLEGTGVTANSLHPGAVATGLGQNNGSLGKRLTGLLAPLFLTPEQGAATSLHVATAPELEKTSGRYFAQSRERTPSAAARDDEAARRLWQESLGWTGLSEDDPWST